MSATDVRKCGKDDCINFSYGKCLLGFPNEDICGRYHSESEGDQEKCERCEGTGIDPDACPAPIQEPEPNECSECDGTGRQPKKEKCLHCGKETINKRKGLPYCNLMCYGLRTGGMKEL